MTYSNHESGLNIQDTFNDLEKCTYDIKDDCRAHYMLKHIVSVVIHRDAEEVKFLMDEDCAFCANVIVNDNVCIRFRMNQKYVM